MEKLRQNEADTAVTPMEIARIEEILIGGEAAERSLYRMRRKDLKNQ